VRNKHKVKTSSISLKSIYETRRYQMIMHLTQMDVKSKIST